MNTEWYFRLSIFVIFALYLAGCSELKNGPQTTNPVFVYVHPEGFKSPTSAEFHGVTIQNAGWEMRTCRQCHGGSYAGANAISCISSGCHVDANGNAKSPESCSTCHGNFAAAADDTLSWAPPRNLGGDTSSAARGVGAHQVHLMGSGDLSNTKLSCQGCHSVPSSVYSTGHFNPQGAAQVILTNALATTSSSGLTPTPAYDTQSLQCNNTFCHGDWRLQKSTSQYKFVFTDSVISGANFSPQWTGGDTQDACGTCHGIPPAGHQNFGTNVNTCTFCHYLDPSKQSGPLDKSIHINGKIDLYGEEYSFR